MWSITLCLTVACKTKISVAPPRTAGGAAAVKDTKREAEGLKRWRILAVYTQPNLRSVIYWVCFLLLARTLLTMRQGRSSRTRRRHICLCWRTNYQTCSHCCCSYGTRYSHTHIHVQYTQLFSSTLWSHRSIYTLRPDICLFF